MNPTAETTVTLSAVTPPLWRVQVIRVLQILGTGAAALGGFDLTPWSAFLDPKLAAALIAGGLFARTEAPQIINFIGDLADNGKLDGSFKNGLGRIPSIIIAAFLALSCGLMLTGCGVGGLTVLPPTADGCFLIRKAGATEDGRAYAAGPCVAADGKIDRYRALWLNKDGVTFESTYTVATKRLKITYQVPGQPALSWDSKSGIALDLPPGIALDGSA